MRAAAPHARPAGLPLTAARTAVLDMVPFYPAFAATHIATNTLGGCLHQPCRLLRAYGLARSMPAVEPAGPASTLLLFPAWDLPLLDYSTAHT